MGVPELVRALRAEAEEQARAIGAAARRERDRLLEEARQAIQTERAAALARARTELEARRADDVATALMGQERALLVDQRLLLAELRAEADRRLLGAADEQAVHPRIDELIADLGEGDLDVVVDPGRVEAVRAYLARAHAQVFARATVRAAEAPRGGVEVTVAGSVVLDNTMPARLEKAWPLLEAEVAATLFGAGDGAL